jgi:hypothetical protein
MKIAILCCRDEALKIIETVVKLEKQKEIIVVNIKNSAQTSEPLITPINYYHQMLIYNEELISTIQELEKDKSNQKPFRKGSKFIPLKKRR